VSEILNGTSAQLGYKVPFKLVHAGKYRTEDKLKMQTIHKLNTTQKKQTTQNTPEQNYGSLVQSPFMAFGQEIRWAYSTMLPSPHRAGHALPNSGHSWTVPCQKDESCYSMYF